MSDSKYPEEKTEAWYGNEYIQKRVLELYPTIEEEIESCLDHTQLAMHVTYDAIRNGLLGLKDRGVRLKCISEVTPENIIYCKRLIVNSSYLQKQFAFKEFSTFSLFIECVPGMNNYLR